MEPQVQRMRCGLWAGGRDPDSHSQGSRRAALPFIQGFHPSPGDYRRYTEEGLRAELNQLGFVVEDSGLAVGPGSAMAWITSEFLALLVSGRSVLGYRAARNLTRVLAMPIKYADAWLEDHPMANRIPSAVWAIAHTPEDVAARREHDVHSPSG